MSFVLMKRFEDCIKVVTDSAAWDQQGNIAWLGSKVRRAANGQPLAVTCTGCFNSASLYYNIFDCVTAQENVDESLSVMERKTVTATEIADHLQGKSDRALNAIIAGYSAERGFFLAQECSEPLTEKLPAGKWYHTPGKVQYNLCDPEGVLELDENPFNVKLQNFDNFIVPFVKWQRSKVVKFVGRDVPMITVGGKIEVTTITADGASTEVVHDFGDVIGKPIEVAA